MRINGNRPETKLITLLQTQEDYDLWEKEGEEWEGIFDLSPESESHQIFNS